MTWFCQQFQQTENRTVNLSSLLHLSYNSTQATTSQFVSATCGSVCVGSIAHPQQSRWRSLTCAID